MRMKLGTLKRIIREAVEAQINEVWRSDAEIEATRRAAETFPFRNKQADAQVAADRERQAAGDAAYRERMKAEQEAQQAAVEDNRKKHNKYMADMRAVAEDLGVEQRVIDNLIVNAYVDYQKYPRPDGNFFTDEEIVMMAERDLRALLDGTKTPLDISKAARDHTAAALRAFRNKPPHRSM